jgi:hypothetical protein
MTLFALALLVALAILALAWRTIAFFGRRKAEPQPNRRLLTWKASSSKDTTLQGVDLLEVRNVTQEQIDQAQRDQSTQLPDGLYRPASRE